jgi:hypothetical protein
VTIGVCYPDPYAVEETFQLLKTGWDWYERGRTYDVVIARKADVSGYHGPLIDITDDDIFKTIRTALNTGRPHVHEPVCEIHLDNLRRKLREHMLLVEIPPSPWSFSYMVALTHDVDLLSIRERRWLSAGYVAFRCLCKGLVPEACRIFLAKCGACKDPWDLFSSWIEIENELGVRSTFFLLPSMDRAGACSPPVRAGYYPLESAPIPELIRNGWEAGVHGIDNWIDENCGKEEIALFRRYGLENIGNRVHWLLYNENSPTVLDRAGYFYDSTVGYNDDIGFRAGTLQVYRPAGTQTLVELPLHIQDIALFGTSCWELSGTRWIKIPCLNLDEVHAGERIAGLMKYAGKYGGVVTILWHYESISSPACLEPMYRNLIKKAQDEKAWIAPAGTIVQWFLARRSLRISCKEEKKCLVISAEGNMKFTHLPACRLRVYIPPDRIRSVDAPFIPGPDYIDINLSHTPIHVLIQ